MKQYKKPKLYHICLLLLVFAGNPFLLEAQSKRAYIRAGDAAFAQKDFGAAMNYYGAVVQKGSEQIAVKWKYAESARQLFALDIAAKTYEEIIEADQKKGKYPQAYLYLGQIRRTQGKYTEALEALNKYLEIARDTLLRRQAQTHIEHTQWAMNNATLGASKQVNVSHLDKKINSAYSDFAPFPKGDSLYFSSYRFEKKSSKTLPKERITRTMISIGGKQAREPGKGIPAADSAHVAHLSFSPDGHYLFFTFCKNRNSHDIRCEIWLLVQDIKGKWSKPIRLPEAVNAKGFSSTHPNVGQTNSGHLNLWFSSDRPGGKGKFDLWSVALDTNWFCPCNAPIDARKPQKLPKFANPVPLAALNTAGDDMTPFYHAPSNILYFSSDGWPGYGGFDIFGSVESETGTTPPQNLGSKVNTTYNDLYYAVKNDGYTAYLSSNRPGAIFLDERNKACCNDLYKLEYPVPPPPINDSPLITAKVTPPQPALPTVPPPTVVPPTPVLEDFVGLPLYFDNDEPDKRTRKTTTLKTYEESVLAYLDRQEEYQVALAAGLPALKAQEISERSDRFFEEDVRAGYERLNQLCELLYTQMQADKQVEILIKGFTSPRAETSYNFNLGKRRISSVYNHIATWNNNTLEPFLKNGQLSVKETSFGELTAKKGISDDLKDERNSIYNTDAAKERRVEIVQIKTDH